MTWRDGSYASHCYSHRWHPVYTRRVARGKRRGSWRWKFRCAQCAAIRLFYTPYEPASANGNGHHKLLSISGTHPNP